MTCRSILIVDDDRSFVEALAIYLEDHGYRVVKAHNGRDGIFAAVNHRFDLALIDVHLPDFTGTAVAGEIKQWYPNLLTVLMSSDDSPEVARQCRAACAHAFLAKPVAPCELLATIADAVRAQAGEGTLATS